MDKEKVALVQSSFAKVAPIAQTAAGLFYGRLFELDPSLRALFKNDMEEQGRKLMQMLSVAVAALDKPNTLIPAVQSLGARHKAYGVKDSHYNTVGEALLWTLEKGLGEDFTPAVRGAWAETYGLLSSVMIKAADDARAGAPVAS